MVNFDYILSLINIWSESISVLFTNPFYKTNFIMETIMPNKTKSCAATIMGKNA